MTALTSAARSSVVAAALGFAAAAPFVGALPAPATGSVRPSAGEPAPAALSIAAGETALFTVATARPGARFRWQKDGVPLSATAATFQIPAVSESDAGEYAVVVSTERRSTVSRVAVLTVAAPALDPAARR